jgi:hypothetical protein
MTTQTHTVFQTEHQTFVVKSADDSVFDNFDYDELLAIGYALRDRAESLAPRVPLYAGYLNAIADKISTLVDSEI